MIKEKIQEIPEKGSLEVYQTINKNNVIFLDFEILKTSMICSLILNKYSLSYFSL